MWIIAKRIIAVLQAQRDTCGAKLVQSMGGAIPKELLPESRVVSINNIITALHLDQAFL